MIEEWMPARPEANRYDAMAFFLMSCDSDEEVNSGAGTGMARYGRRIVEWDSAGFLTYSVWKDAKMATKIFDEQYTYYNCQVDSDDC